MILVVAITTMIVSALLLVHVSEPAAYAAASTSASASATSASVSAASTSASASATSVSASSASATSASAASASATSASASASSDDGIAMVLFINSYDPGFDTVPVVSEQIAEALKGQATIHYLYMNEKYETDEFASQQLSAQLDYLTAIYHYDAVILGDDAALDYAIANRDRYFKDIPLVYEDVNSVEKAKLYEDDPLITGVVEAFPMKETIELARQVMPKATRVVVISDGSVSAAGSVRQALAEEADFPDLTFETFDCSTRTPEQIQSDIAAYGDDTILLYTVFNVDGSGNRYGVSQGVKLVTDAAQVPVFKADGVGVGDELIGGYVLSYESIGKQTARIVLDVLDGTSTPAVVGYTTGTCEYLFDANVMQRFHISKSKLPANSVYINDAPSFMETYGWLLISGLIIAALIIVAIILNGRKKHSKLMRELDERNLELKAEEAANRAKTEFISRMSHDVRTPLNAIMGMEELAMQDADDPNAVRTYLGKSRASGELLISLVNNILDVSKIESGKMQLESAPCDLQSFIADLRSIFEPLCERKGIEFEVDDGIGDINVLTDHVRLNQIFCNLLSNAVKFTPEGGRVTLSLAGHRIADRDGEKTMSCDFYVADTGQGISEEFQEKMFSAFTQDRGVARSTGQGSGLGLTIVKSIVELMGGSIAVKSEAGLGTTFIVHLDLLEAPMPKDAVAGDAIAAADAAGATDPSAVNAATAATTAAAATAAAAPATAAAAPATAAAAPATATAAGPAAATAGATAAFDPVEAAQSKLAGHSVLVVEDNDINAEIIITVLERSGMSVTHASDGKIAVDMVGAAADGAYDVILMDNRMPVMSGLEATSAIRAMDDAWAKSVPIIAITADAFDDDIKSFMDAGMNAYLTKPIDVRKLYRKIAEFI